MTAGIATEVMQRGPDRFDMAGQLLPSHVFDTDGEISQGTAARLVRYARERLTAMGIPLLSEWTVTVSTCDADRPPSERVYHVGWRTPQGASIGVQGIMTNHGWPCLDHGTYLE